MSEPTPPTAAPTPAPAPPPSPAPAPRPASRRAFRAGILAASLVLLLGVLEAGLRATGRQPRPRTVNGYFFVSDPRLGWRNRPDGEYAFGGFGSTVRTGARGERLGVRSSPDPTGPTVLFVGDSTTFCAEVEDEETGPSEVAKLLPPGRAPFVVNAGVRAYGTLQAVRQAEEWLARAPVQVVVYTYADNDFVETVNPIVNPARAPRGRLSADGNVVVDEAPEPEGGWGRPIDDAGVLPVGRRLLLGSARTSAFANLVVEKLGVGFFFRARQLEDGAFGPIATAEQWARAVAWADEHRSGEVIRELLRELDAAAKAKGASLLVTRFTDHAGRTGKVEHERFLEAVAASGVRFVDVGPAFGEDRSVYHPPPVRPGAPQDAHYGKRGTIAYATALAPRILELLPPR